MKFCARKIWLCTADFIRGNDCFANPVSLTFKGKKNITTFIGGVFSILMISIVLCYGGILINILINKSETMRSLSISNRDISSNPIIYSLNSDNFGVSLLFTDKSENPFFDSSYFDMSFSQASRVNNSSGTSTNLSDRGKTKCNLSSSHTDRAETIKGYSYCSANSSFEVSGNSMSQEMKYIQIDFKKCKGSPSCQSDATINSKLKNGQVYLNFKINYLDFNDYETPVKSVINDKHYFRIIPGFQKVVYIYLEKNEAELRDGLYNLIF